MSQVKRGHSPTIVRPPVPVEDENAPSSSKRSKRDDATVLSTRMLELDINEQHCGKIACIHLKNFMCHANLRIDLHPRVNFMVGSNGSGKSAILAAVVLGLGANARATSRSTNMKELIRTGESTAKIEITLHNGGRVAYEPTVYGNAITVVRTITRNSTSIAIKNQDGRVISRKCDALHRLTLYYNIQVDNPAFVLNQDSSREFLRDLNPEKCYKFFLKATQIDLIMDKLNDCRTKQSEHLKQLDCYVMKLNRETDEIDKLRAQLALALSGEKIKEKIDQYELQLLWKAVERYEHYVSEFANKISVLEKNRDALHTEVGNKDKIMAELNQKIIEIQDKLKSHQLSYNTKTTELVSLKAKARIAKLVCVDLNTACDNLKNRHESLEKQGQDLNKYIVEHTRQTVDEIQELRRKNEDALKLLCSQYDDYVAIVASAHRDLKLFCDTKLQIEEQIRAWTDQKANKQTNIQHILCQIENVKASRRTALSAYGSEITQLVAEIERAHEKGKFSEMPRGPLGRYVEVPNGGQRDMIEMQLRQVMETFLVNNSADRHVLMALFKRFAPNQRISLITMRFHKKVHDVSNGCVRPPPDTNLLMDMIRCSDPVVMNCLIDRLQIERVLVAATKEVAELFTSEMRNVPQNLSKIVCCVGGMHLEYHPDPQYRLYSIPMRKARYLQVDVEERITNLEQTKQTLQEEIKAMDAKAKEFQQTRLATLQRIKDKGTVTVKQEAKKQQIYEQITALENFEYPETSKAKLLHRELEETTRKIEVARNNLAANQIKLQDAKIEVNKIREEIAEKVQSLHTSKADIADADTIFKKLKSDICNHEKTTKRKMIQLQEQIEMLQECENAIKQKRRALEMSKSAAQERGERLISDRSDEEIEEEIHRLKMELNKPKSIKYKPQELSEKIERSESALRKDEAIYEGTKSVEKNLKNSLAFRYNFMEKLRTHMTSRLQFMFSNLMKLRNFDGKVDVNHKEQRLTIKVVKCEKDMENAVGSTHVLSGGERSYTTVAFLIALWSCVDHPFYFLDEYDIFTDEVNREFMTRLLIKEGKDRPNRQYMFLTPQDMSLQAEDFIKIHRLAPVDDDGTEAL